MSPISNLWRQLVQRRLWPVAVLLIAALAAVPLTLAKQPESAPAPDPLPGSAGGSGELATQPIVALATETDRAKRRKVLGKAKNPFAKPVQLGGSANSGPKAAPAPKKPKSDGGGGTDFADTPVSIGGGATPSTPSTPSSPPVASPPTGVPVAPAPDRPEPARHSLTVRFGGDSALARMNVKRLEALPLGEEPLVVYLGVADGGDSAVFLVDSSVTPDGDGECMPDPNTCETIHLREGETEFFDILGEDGEPAASYQLDLVEIHGGKKSSAGRTASASKAVRRALRAHAAAPGALQYRVDSDTGKLRVASVVTRTADVGLALP